MAKVKNSLLLVLIFWSGSSIRITLADEVNNYFSSSLKLFRDCLVVWRYRLRPEDGDDTFKSFNKLRREFFTDTAHILQVSRGSYNISDRKNINVLKAPPPPHLRYTKFSSCHVLFHQIIRNNFVALKHKMEIEMGDFRFVIYFATDPALDLPETMPNNLIRFNFSSVPLLLDDKGNLNIAVPRKVLTSLESSKLLTLPVNLESLSDIEYLWLEFHRDLKGLPLVVPQSNVDINLCYDDSSLLWVSPGITCLKKYIVSSLNLSLSHVGLLQIPKLDLMMRLVLAEHIMMALRLQRGDNFRYEIPIPSVEHSPYAFVIVAEEKYFNSLGAMTQPFQMSTWLAIFIAMAVMPISLMFTSTKSRSIRAISVGSYMEWFFLTLASVVGQCNDSIRRYFKTDRSLALWVIWNFFSLIVMNCYDGQLYSFLASKRIPPAPGSLRELAHSRFPVVTVSTQQSQDENGYQVLSSSLKYFLDVTSVSKRANKNGTGSRRKRRYKYYDKLFKKLVFISNQGKHFTRITRDILTHEKLQKGFAFADDMEHVKVLDAIMDLMKTKTVIKRQRINNFVSTEGWLVRKYFLYNRIVNVAWRMKESGIYGFWNSNIVLQTQLRTIKQIKADSNSSFANDWKPYNNIAYLQRSEKKRSISGEEGEEGHKKEENAEPTPMTLNTIAGVLRLCLAISALSVSFLVGEIVWFLKQVRRNEIRHFRNRLEKLTFPVTIVSIKEREML